MTFFRTIAFLLLLTITSIGIQICQYPSLLLQTTASLRKLYKWYHVQTQQSFASLILIITWIFSPISIVLSGDYDSLRSTHCVLIANHQIYTDWWYIWILACQHGFGGNIKIILKHELCNIPIFGWGMQFFEFIFLRRKWAHDKPVLISCLEKARSDGNPIWLLLFPGTNITPGTRQKTLGYAASKGITKIPRHLLIPRSTGLYTSLEELGKNDFVTDLIDITIGYDRVKAHDCPQYKYPILDVFFKGTGPKVVYLHISSFKVTEIMGFDETRKKDVFDGWLQEWYLNQKDNDLDSFYTKGTFGTDKDIKIFKPIPKWHDWLRVTFFSWIAIKFMILLINKSFIRY